MGDLSTHDWQSGHHPESDVGRFILNYGRGHGFSFLRVVEQSGDGISLRGFMGSASRHGGACVFHGISFVVAVARENRTGGLRGPLLRFRSRTFDLRDACLCHIFGSVRNIRPMEKAVDGARCLDLRGRHGFESIKNGIDPARVAVEQSEARQVVHQAEPGHVRAHATFEIGEIVGA